MRHVSKTPLTSMLVGLISLAATLPLSAQTLEGQELRSLISGKRVYLETPYGVEFPLYYQVDGSVTGDGTDLGLARFFAPRETGEWWVDGNNLCQRFPTWYDGETSCFTIQRTGDVTLEWTRDDGQSGSARIAG